MNRARNNNIQHQHFVCFGISEIKCEQIANCVDSIFCVWTARTVYGTLWSGMVWHGITIGIGMAAKWKKTTNTSDIEAWDARENQKVTHTIWLNEDKDNYRLAKRIILSGISFARIMLVVCCNFLCVLFVWCCRAPLFFLLILVWCSFFFQWKLNKFFNPTTIECCCCLSFLYLLNIYVWSNTAHPFFHTVSIFIVFTASFPFIAKEKEPLLPSVETFSRILFYHCLI